MIQLHLTEGGPPLVRSLDESTGDALARSGVVVAVRLGGPDWEISAASKIGVAVIHDVELWIRPKIDIARVMFLLGYAKNPGWIEDSAPMDEVSDLVPALAGAFADQAERALGGGRLQGYSEVNDSSTVLRGRIREQEQIRRHFGLALPLLVAFDDYTMDIAENQILLAATEMLLHLASIPASSRLRLRRIRRTLGEVSAPPRGSQLPRWIPNRLNKQYHVALWLAELLLKKNAVDQTPGDVHVNGFLVDMAKVFEDFVTAAMMESLKPFGGWARPQDRQYLDVDDEVLMKPDLVWYLEGKPAAVVDAKYKSEKPAGFPDADLYQMLAYCTALGLTEGHLIYAKGNELETTHRVRHCGIGIHTRTLDLNAPPSDILSQLDVMAAGIASQAAVQT